MAPRTHRFAWVGLLFVVAAIVGTFAWISLRPRDAAVVPAHPTSVSMAPASFVGSTACAACHSKETAAWQSSDHRLAMQHASADAVLGNFNDATFRHAGVESRFFKRDGRYFVRTDGPDGKLTDFEVKYTFGARPLQQYLIEFPDGRLQALSIAWDTRPASEGGQRWFHLYGNEKIDHRDELHWTRGQQNWNFMCADCHSVDLRKGYDAATNRFASTWKDLTVGCEACHGPGSTHVAWAAGKDASVAHKGLTVTLDQRRGVAWPIDPATGNARRSTDKKSDAEIEVCAQCHARRSQIAEGYHAGKAFLDHYRPALLTPPLYYADGQQRDEVFTWGSFLQSKMYAKGVTCSDCHEPHSLKLRAEGNAVCAQCHLSTKYDAPSHTHHAAGTAGSRCVDCHMPSTNYMVVDGRRDHGMRVPRPDLTLSTGSPNACNSCHRENDARWADVALVKWLGRRPGGLQNYAEAFAALAKGSATANAELLAVARDLSQPG
ncbi:MAG: cytochrome c3 family protein, partial [Burkholderiaceae bacterium]